MRAIFTALALSLALPMAACSADPNTPAESTADQGGQAESAATIPVTITAAGKAHVFNVEVASTDEEQDRGLMFRTSLPEGGGMIFPFKKPRIGSFWMKNTLIPLDMFFIRADGSIDRIAENTIPESLEPVVSGGEVSAVLELAGGTAAKLGIDETAKITWKDTK
ncbi:hypothetical protein ASE06_01170 [Sphingopyxis sp. Root214]|uniref:DUF192 domain-containing protein n=1 Tax=unclassified Sphingopyxis TaxID=2614943 RepID=UPI0006FD0A87|nr:MULTISPECIES: DUF192 domain-containing protein [unclassified Sphingopyxis]KQZ69462.1 hypothetical protein ASD73_20845 [Sphingopyxis sp. Root154]KRC10862.1 hypothetical protein ASE06_01170 [Sphingopyxis sp. Root214]